MLDFPNASIQRLVKSRQWNALEHFSRIKAIYNFVRDEIQFGYNVDDVIPASRLTAAANAARGVGAALGIRR